MTDRDDAQQIRDLIATWMAATRAGDVDAVLALMADDVVFLVAGQPPMVGRDAYAAAARAMAGPGAPRIEGTNDVEEVVVSGDLAVVRTRLRVAVTPPGATRPTVRAGHTLTVFRKQDGRWRLLRDANLLAPVADAG
jgi:uncharacterized protein (TIGR02246 family)